MECYPRSRRSRLPGRLTTSRMARRDATNDNAARSLYATRSRLLSSARCTPRLTVEDLPRTRLASFKCRAALKRIETLKRDFRRGRGFNFFGRSCLICLEVLTAFESTPLLNDGSDEQRIVLPCSHTFHAHCLRGWISDESRDEVSCPVCAVNTETLHAEQAGRSQLDLLDDEKRFRIRRWHELYPYSVPLVVRDRLLDGRGIDDFYLDGNCNEFRPVRLRVCVCRRGGL